MRKRSRRYVKMVKPSIFVGSSTEGLEVARAVQYQLAEDGEVELWNEGVFSLGYAALESLVQALNRFDFAVLVLTPDDLTASRGVEQRSARDNVLIELGLFIGRLGRERTFLLVCKDKDLRIPSDLAGITFATFSLPADESKLTSAVGPACTKVRNAIRALGPAAELRRLAEAVKTTGEAVRKQEKEIRDQREIIQLIHEALRRSLTKYEYQHLVELESGAPSPNYEYSDFLLNEMIRLCQHGYAAETFDHSTWRMKEQGDRRFDLKDFYRITDEGKNHLELLRRLEALISNERSENEV
jgi:hypothetical protein